MARLCSFGLGNVDLWRSETMELVQLIVPAESAHDTVAALGELGMLQFKDLNTDKSAFQRNYANQVKRCEEMARRLRFLTTEVEKANLAIVPRTAFAKVITVDELEGQLEELESEVLQVNSNSERLTRTRAELTELQLLLERGSQFFETARQQAIRDQSSAPADLASQQDMSAPLLSAEAGTSYGDKGRLGFLAGLIAQDKLLGFERLLFRATRGNVFVRATPVGSVQDPASGEKIAKCVFVVFSSGDRAKAKVTKICEAFGANRYPLPEEPLRQRQAALEVEQRLAELSTTLAAGDSHRQNVLRGLASNLDQWVTLVRREKAIYHTLNKMSMDHSRKVLVAEAWVPSVARAQVSEVLRVAAQQSSDQQVSTVVQHLSIQGESPPTYFRTNKFTECFQAIVEAYGVARYREVNPTVYSIMTFPFLFAVMFGDFGHGALMLMFALLLLINEKKLLKTHLDDMSSMAFGGRYCILLMSIYSMYTGALYNEFFAMPMTLAGPSHWECPKDDGGWLHSCPDGLVMKQARDPYPFGVDPAWRGTKTELPYLNSMKMKMSIIMGVTHMNLGILMSLFNNQYFRDPLSTWAEFVPQMIFLNGLFGYLSFLIIFKWVTGSTADLYHVLITMFLNPGTVDEQAYLFPYQDYVQIGLLLAALVAVPCMLFPKPLILNARHKAAQAQAGEEYDHLDGGEAAHGGGGGGGGHGGHGHGEFDFGEVFVHQMIHSIEFVLGAVSNTASYLRLWALSLAHSQLSGVFYERVLMAALQSGSWTAMVIGFFVWAMATLGVLMVMESLSAFLHALRLHWVEFMNKFYHGDGYLFTPLDLQKSAAQGDEP